jgi:hypothetical protein
MTAPRDPERLIRAFLAEGQDQLPDRAYDAVRDTIDRTRQRTVFGPWRETQMFNFARVAIAAAAVVAFGVVGIGMLARPAPGPGGEASPSASAPPSSQRASAGPSRMAAHLGPLEAGTYSAQPWGSLGITFTVPEGWEGVGTTGRVVGIYPTDPGWEPPAGMGVGWVRVASLNSDPCHWDGAENDIAIGPTAADLVTALTQQTAYDVSDPAAVSLGGYSGTQVDIVFPDDVFATPSPSAPGASPGPPVAVGCDEQEYRIWNGNEGFDIYAFGPGARWHIWSLDVEGERVVVFAHDHQGTSDADVAVWEAIIRSVGFEP